MRALVPLLLALAWLAPSSASACAACACGDPTLTAMGTGKNFAGRLRLSTAWRRRAESVPMAFGAGRVTEDRLTVAAAWSPIDRVQVAVELPWVVRAVSTPTLARDLTSAPGDAELRARWFVAGARGRTPLQLGLVAGLRAPTGTALRDDAGALLPLDSQPGNGAWMPSAGVWTGLFAHPWSVYWSATGWLPFAGHDDFTVGPVALSTLFVRRQWDTLATVRAGVDARLSARDAFAGRTVEASGGTTAFALVGGGLGLGETLLNATLRWPIYDDRRGGDRAAPSFELSVTHDL